MSEDPQAAPNVLQLPDWNKLWKQVAHTKRVDPGHRSDYWNQRASSFARKGTEARSSYAETFLDFLAPQPHWTVLDVGCGPGILAHPLARQVQHVTAMDFSEAMIAQLLKGCEEKGLSNVRAVHGSWEDDWESLGIGTYDTAFASRSLIVDDLEQALRKLDRAARHRVLISFSAGSGPMDTALTAALGRKSRQGADYIYVYNMLHQMGICADVRVLKVRDERCFDTSQEALKFYRTFLSELTPEEDVKLQDFLNNNLVQNAEGRWNLEGGSVRSWALMRWDKEA